MPRRVKWPSTEQTVSANYTQHKGLDSKKQVSNFKMGHSSKTVKSPGVLEEGSALLTTGEMHIKPQGDLTSNWLEW